MMRRDKWFGEGGGKHGQEVNIWYSRHWQNKNRLRNITLVKWIPARRRNIRS